MRKLMTATMIALVFVGATIADYDTSDHNRGAVLASLADRDIAQQTNTGETGEAGNGFGLAFTEYGTHFSEYYELTSELVY